MDILEKVECGYIEYLNDKRILMLKCIKKHVFPVNEVFRLNGTSFLARCPRCANQKSAQQRDREQENNLIKFRIFESKLPPLFMNSNFDTYIADSPAKANAKNQLLEFCNNLDSNIKSRRNIMLCGNVGNGKTHLGLSVARYAMERGYRGYSALYTKLLDVMDKMHEAPWKTQEALNYYSIPDILLLDEIGFLTDKQQESLSRVIDKRYEQSKINILISNLEAEELRKQLGVRIVDRLRDNNGLIIKFIWESYRK